MRKLGVLLASFLLSCVSALFLAQPAEAIVGPTQKICNSSNSVAWIKVWRIGGGSGFPSYIAPDGTCGTFAQTDNELRVDVDPEWGPSDVDSYRIGQEGEGYGPCHSGENDSSDPPNISPRYVKYNTDVSGC
jgi:hypothetical protein